jgi:hypothetical protein
MKKIFSLLVILIFSAAFFPGCKKDKGVPPTLPPQESMTIDFTNFSSAKKSLELVSGQKGTENSNWVYAASVAGFWNLILNVTLAVPVAAFKLAVNQSPVYISTKNWQWSYNVTFLNVIYKARLTGLIRATDVQWKMYISREGTGGFAEFLWFEGTSMLDGTGGQWILYESALAPDAILQIDWTKTGLAVGYIKYTYVKNDSFKNSYIEYGLTSSTIFNAYYTIHKYNSALANFSDVNIEWNITTQNGRIKSSNYLLGGWYCWDTNKLNVVCQ